MTLDGLKVNTFTCAWHDRILYALECENPHWLGDKAHEICETFLNAVNVRGGWSLYSASAWPGHKSFFVSGAPTLLLQVEYKAGEGDELVALLAQIVEESKQW